MIGAFSPAARVRARVNRRARLRRLSPARRIARQVQGLGRSASEKRTARAGRLDLILTGIDDNLQKVIDNISTGRQRPDLPKLSPTTTDADASQNLADAILDYLPGKTEQLQQAFGTPQKPQAAQTYAPAAGGGGGLSQIAASPLFIPGIMLAIMALK